MAMTGTATQRAPHLLLRLALGKECLILRATRAGKQAIYLQAPGSVTQTSKQTEEGITPSRSRGGADYAWMEKRAEKRVEEGVRLEEEEDREQATTEKDRLRRADLRKRPSSRQRLGRWGAVLTKKDERRVPNSGKLLRSTSEKHLFPSFRPGGRRSSCPIVGDKAN